MKKKKTFLQKFALVVVILAAVNVVPGMVCLVDVVDPGSREMILSNSAYLAGWIGNFILISACVIITLGIKLVDYSQNGKWNRNIYRDI